MYNKIAKEIVGKEPYVECTTCGKKILLSVDRVSSNLRNGWEKCCGYTMRYYSGK